MRRALLALEDFVFIPPPAADALDDDEACLAFCLVVAVEVLDGVWYADCCCCCLTDELSSLELNDFVETTLAAKVDDEDAMLAAVVTSLIVLLLLLLELLKFVSKSYKHG